MVVVVESKNVVFTVGFKVVVVGKVEVITFLVVVVGTVEVVLTSSSSSSHTKDSGSIE